MSAGCSERSEGESYPNEEILILLDKGALSPFDDSVTFSSESPCLALDATWIFRIQFPLGFQGTPKGSDALSSLGFVLHGMTTERSKGCKPSVEVFC